MREVGKTIVVVLAMRKIRRKIAVVDPDVLGLLDGDSVTTILVDLAEAHVLDDDVLGSLDEETGADELAVGVLAQDGLVAADLDLLAALDGALDVDDRGLVVLDGRDELVVALDGDRRAASTTGRAAILGSVTNGTLSSSGSGGEGSCESSEGGKGRQGTENRDLHIER